MPLSAAHGGIRSFFEPKVDPRSEQTEVCKTFLQVSNVITYLRAAGIIFQNAVAQAEASQLDFVKRLLSQHSVDNDPPILLELTQTRFEHMIEYWVVCGTHLVAQTAQVAFCHRDDGIAVPVRKKGVHKLFR